ncbi:MAG: DUF5703 domain-containing protein [Chthoniobacteraceae bacterium]
MIAGNRYFGLKLSGENHLEHRRLNAPLVSPILFLIMPETNIAPPVAVPPLVWDTPSGKSLHSVPLGNGEIGLNVWVEPPGDILFFHQSVIF